MKIKQRISLAGTLLALTGGLVLGAEKSAVNPTGTWKVTVISTNATARGTTRTLKLTLKGGVLTGTLSYNTGSVINGKAPTSELPISEAKLDGDEISFSFSHPPATGKGPNATYHYQGKITGDTIKGAFTTEWMGETRTRQWQADRLKE